MRRGRADDDGGRSDGQHAEPVPGDGARETVATHDAPLERFEGREGHRNVRVVLERDDPAATGAVRSDGADEDGDPAALGPL